MKVSGIDNVGKAGLPTGRLFGTNAVFQTEKLAGEIKNSPAADLLNPKSHAEMLQW